VNRSRWYLALLLAAAAASSCGKSGGSSAARPATPPTAASSSPPVGDAPAKPGHVPRAAVVATLSRGFGAFLGRLDTEPMLVDGRFHGWRILRVADRDPMWKGVDLGPGDVVTNVNGRPLERPEQALKAFQALAIDPQLRVAYERNGKPRELVYVIDDAPAR
jgi:S1-C subfamily serine protease